MLSSSEDSVPRYGVPAILIATFVPAILVIFGSILASTLDGVVGNVATMAYLLFEALILWLAIVIFTRREHGSFSFALAIPWQKSISPLLFIALLIAVTVYAIFFRDHFRWPPMMAFAGTVRELVPFWPPEGTWQPNFGYQFDDFGGTTRQLNIVAMAICMAAVSVMQTLYFRGFLLPRMAWMGWLAPFINTALFAGFHLYSMPFWHFFFIFTLAWGLVTYATRNVWIAVLSHVIFNTYAYAILIVSG